MFQGTRRWIKCSLCVTMHCLPARVSRTDSSSLRGDLLLERWMMATCWIYRFLTGEAVIILRVGSLSRLSLLCAITYRADDITSLRGQWLWCRKWRMNTKIVTLGSGVYICLTQLMVVDYMYNLLHKESTTCFGLSLWPSHTNPSYTACEISHPKHFIKPT